MKTILVNTSHNIAIKYELASVMHRSLACFVDLVIVIAYLIGIGNVFSEDNYLYYFFMLLIPGFYHLFCEVFFNGQSPGKKIMNIRVVKLNGKKPSIEDYFLRWIFRSIEVLGSLGALAAINISSTENNQRIGDLLAGTTVIKVIPENAVGLDTLKSLAEKKRDITYPKVTMYSDKDMLLVKEGLNRLKENPNEANKSFITQLAKRVREDLDVTYDTSHPVFLETILVDYIFLTR